MPGPEDAKRDRLFALALCLPALVLAWPGPGSLLADVFAATELTAAGVALLATLPAAVFCALRSAPRRPKGVLLFFTFSGGLAVFACFRLLWGVWVWVCSVVRGGGC